MRQLVKLSAEARQRRLERQEMEEVPICLASSACEHVLLTSDSWMRMRPPLGSLVNPRLHAPLSMTQQCGNEQGTPFTLAQARVRRIYKSTPVQFAICLVIVAAYICALVNAQVQVNV